MTTTLSAAGTPRTVYIEYTADETKLLAVMENFSKYLYKDQQYKIDDGNEGYKLWDDLTNAEKLDIFDQGVKNIILDLAKRQYKLEQIELARATAETEAESNMSLNGS